MANQNTPLQDAEVWINRFKRHAGDIFRNSLLVGTVIFICSYGGLFLAIRTFPSFFVDYISPVFNSDGSRNGYFYLHPFVLAIALSVFWNRFGKYFTGNIIKAGVEFGVVYAFVALVPILWITYAAMEVEFQMVFTWLIYGLAQSCVAGMVFYWKGHK